MATAIYSHYANYAAVLDHWTREETKRRIEEREEAIRTSRSFPLPWEIIEHEIVPKISFIDLLFYSEMNHASRRLVSERDLLKRSIERMIYDDLSVTIVAWFRSGLRIEEALRMLSECGLGARIDLIILQRCYLILLEQKRDAFAENLRDIVRTISIHKDLVLWHSWMRITIADYDVLHYLIRMIKENRDHKHWAALFSRAMIIGSSSRHDRIEDYWANLLTRALTAQQIVVLTRWLVADDDLDRSIFIIFIAAVRERHETISPVFFSLVGSFLSEHESVPLFTPRELEYSDQLFSESLRNDNTSPFTREGHIAILKTAHLTTRLPIYLTPLELVQLVNKIPLGLDIFLHLLISIKSQIVKSGYNVWMRELIEKMERTIDDKHPSKSLLQLLANGLSV